jgi:hypothetical protein
MTDLVTSGWAVDGGTLAHRETTPLDGARQLLPYTGQAIYKTVIHTQED